MSNTKSEELAAQIDQYLASGGTIHKLDGFRGVKPKPPATVCPDANLVSTVRKHARHGYSIRYTAMIVGLSRWQVGDLAKNHGIKFRPDPAKIDRI